MPVIRLDQHRWVERWERLTIWPRLLIAYAVIAAVVVPLVFVWFVPATELPLLWAESMLVMLAGAGANRWVDRHWL